MESYHDFSRIYDILIQEDICYEEIASYIIGRVEKKNRYLDLGCGTGTLSILIARHFQETYLVDLSPDMLTEAVSKFTDAGLHHKAYALSMDEIDFRKEFDLVTSSIDALNYLLEENQVQEVFKKVFAHLTADGVFIFDVQSPYKIKEILGNNDFVYTTDDLVYTWENFLDNDTVEMSLNFFVPHGDLYERIEEFHMERAYESGLLVSMLNSAGFKSIELYDNYSKNKPMQTTERWTIIARKREQNG